tara:strand:+ start:335 stop:622 length:288 start_codon:yes stop_codon:yes gene_type:complete
MKKLTVDKVKDYMSYRTPDELKHCPKAIAAACNDMAEDNYGNHFARAAEPIDYMKLLFFNDPIKDMFTHSYGFHTATGRMLIEKLKERYYEHNEN